jgi:nitroreductase
MKTTLTLAEALKNRKSPRAFSEEIITEEMIGLLFEAARWAPSAMNEQPWLYFYAGKDNPEAFNKVLGVLTGINPQWAKNAQYLIVSVAKPDCVA